MKLLYLVYTTLFALATALPAASPEPPKSTIALLSGECGSPCTSSYHCDGFCRICKVSLALTVLDRPLPFSPFDLKKNSRSSERGIRGLMYGCLMITGWHVCKSIKEKGREEEVWIFGRLFKVYESHHIRRRYPLGERIALKRWLS